MLSPSTKCNTEIALMMEFSHCNAISGAFGKHGESYAVSATLHSLPLHALCCFFNKSPFHTSQVAVIFAFRVFYVCLCHGLTLLPLS